MKNPKSKDVSRFGKKLPVSKTLGLFSLCFLSFNSAADTLVSFQSNVGNFTFELFEDIAPETVAFFLANVEADAYRLNIVHEAGNLAIKSGSYNFNSCIAGAEPRPATSTIPVENTGLPIVTGSLAMARDPDDPNNITGEWQVNLGNNESQYDSTTRPVVFGEVVEGFNIVDSIADLWRVPMNIGPAVPTLNYEGFFAINCNVFNVDNVVRLLPQIVSVDPPSNNTGGEVNVFDGATGLLTINVDAGSLGLLSMSLRLESSIPVVVVQVQPETVQQLSETTEGMSSFDEASGELTIPEIIVGGQAAYSDVVFRLSDSENLFFTLVSANSL